ncbi:hypothetical protein [Lactobacillus delbrueckii]|uniref:hypothetical protein n=1 Tax=Lactobacillus delbrueckii TaxID=1584 RepID=UPI001C703F41|nr:hypothetical protein [Lactobacillus delbrueckii]
MDQLVTLGDHLAVHTVPQPPLLAGMESVKVLRSSGLCYPDSSVFVQVSNKAL